MYEFFLAYHARSHKNCSTLTAFSTVYINVKRNIPKFGSFSIILNHKVNDIEPIPLSSCQSKAQNTKGKLDALTFSAADNLQF